MKKESKTKYARDLVDYYQRRLRLLDWIIDTIPLSTASYYDYREIGDGTAYVAMNLNSKHAKIYIVLDRVSTKLEIHESILHEILHVFFAQVSIPEERSTEEEFVINTLTSHITDLSGDLNE